MECVSLWAEKVILFLKRYFLKRIHISEKKKNKNRQKM